MSAKESIQNLCRAAVFVRVAAQYLQRLGYD